MANSHPAQKVNTNKPLPPFLLEVEYNHKVSVYEAYYVHVFGSEDVVIMLYWTV